jgi:DNA repair exonuclease SbcCD ATPase subunit
LDEPATSLDQEHIIQFGSILEMIKSEFDNIVLITHLDILKDYADKQINVGNKNGFAILED